MRRSSFEWTEATRSGLLIPHAGFFADPAAKVFSDGRLWLYADRDPYGENAGWWGMNDYHAFSTADLLSWTDHGCVLRRQDIAWADGPAWDGDCVEAHGKYWYFFPMIDQIGVAVADQPWGPFRDAIGRPLITRRTPGVRESASGLLVSPVCVFAPDGPFLYFGQNEELYAVPLAKTLTELAGPVRELAHPWRFHESPWVFFRSGKFHMIYGRREILGGLPEDERDVLATAVSDHPYGPFQYTGDVQADQARTVQACLTEWGAEDILFYHEDGPDPLHRYLRAERVARSPEGGAAPTSRGSSPVIAEEVAMDPRSRHLAIDFSRGGGRLDRIHEPTVAPGSAVHMESGSWIAFDNWDGGLTKRCLQVIVRAEQNSARLEASLEDAAKIQIMIPASSDWQIVSADLPDPGTPRWNLILTNTGASGIDVHAITFKRPEQQ